METYSFADCILVLTFPSGGGVISGAGIGDVTIAMAQDRTAMAPAADGNIMISKIAGNHGTVTLNIQQTSPAHLLLLGLYNAQVISPALLWAGGTGLFRDVVGTKTYNFVGLCFQKRGDHGYGAQGAMVTWPFMVADIQAVAG
jgi:hypothetical protein